MVISGASLRCELAACCKLEVVKGAGGFWRRSLGVTEAILKATPCKADKIASASARVLSAGFLPCHSVNLAANSPFCTANSAVIV